MRSRPENFRNRPDRLDTCAGAVYAVGTMDALSAVLAPVRLQRTRWAFTAARGPWGVALPASKSCVRFHYLLGIIGGLAFPGGVVAPGNARSRHLPQSPPSRIGKFVRRCLLRLGQVPL